jgi:hypothetical protein
MNGLFLTGCFSTRKPVGTQGTQRVGAPDLAEERVAHPWALCVTRDEPHAIPENSGVRSYANTAPGLFNPLG